MKVEVETQPGSVSTLQIELPPEEVSKEWDAIANSIARFAKIPGYRPGKAPRAVIASAGDIFICVQASDKIIGIETVGDEPGLKSVAITTARPASIISRARG